jgi:hypothetical protein
MHRRDAIRALMALPAATTITRASLRPGDVVVIECQQQLTPATAVHIRDTLKQIWPDHKVLVIDSGVRLRIVPAGAV